MEGAQQHQEGPYATAMIPRQPSTLERPRPPDRRSHSRQTQSQIGSSRPQTVSKVTRSRSFGHKPAGIPTVPASSYNDVDRRQPPPPSSRSRMSTVSSQNASQKTMPNNTTKAGVVVETMSAPNPFCPNTRGICCLMALINLGLILVAIGFIIVLQLPEPAFVWNIGIVTLVFGFVAIVVSLLYCMCICQEGKHHQPNHNGQPELFWTHHWQKNITIPEIKRKDKQDIWEDHFPEDDLSDTSSRDYPRLYLESDYGNRTDREEGLETDLERAAAKNER